MKITRFVLCIFLIIIFSKCNTRSNKIESSLAPHISTAQNLATDSIGINIELYYRFKDDDFAKELQNLFSEYFSLIINKKATRRLFDSESSNFMSYPGISQSLNLFYDGKFLKIHKPMIIAIYTQDNDTIVKLNYTRVDSTGIATSLATNNFGVTKSDGRLRLKNMVYLNSKNLEIVNVDNITYYFHRTHDFSLQSAKEMQDFNLRISKLFATNPISFRYFVCKSNIELNQLMGFDFKYDMFNMDNSSGLADPLNRIIYAGNGSEYYPHELVHFYTKQWNGAIDHHEWFNEGLATYLGGSRNRSLEWHLEGLVKYLRENDYPDISNPFVLPDQINNTTGTIYVIGGLICKLAYEKGGMDLVKQLFMAGSSNEDFYKGIEQVFGVKKEGLNDFLYENLPNNIRPKINSVY